VPVECLIPLIERHPCVIRRERATQWFGARRCLEVDRQPGESGAARLRCYGRNGPLRFAACASEASKNTWIGIDRRSVVAASGLPYRQSDHCCFAAHARASAAWPLAARDDETCVSFDG
jgi:hypothetical protein